MPFTPKPWPTMAVNVQVEGHHSLGDPIYATARAAGVTIDRNWGNEIVFAPARFNDPIQFMRRFVRIFPGLRNIRLPFNQWQWADADDWSGKAEGEFRHSWMHALCAGVAEVGGGIHWVLMDGPSQRTRDFAVLSQPGQAVQKSYPTLLNLETDWPAALEYIHGGQTAAWNKLATYLDRYPAIAEASYAFEMINEPDSYNRAGREAKDDTMAAEAYLRHNLALGNLIDARHPGRDIFVSGWGYAGYVSGPLSGIKLPNYGGKTARDVLKERFGERFAWSLHVYPGWGPSSDKMEAYTAWESERAGVALGVDRISLTEFNGQDYRLASRDFSVTESRKDFMWVRNLPFFSANKIGVCWWQIHEIGEGSLVKLDAEQIIIEHQHTLAAGLAVMGNDNNAQFFTGPQSGVKVPVICDGAEMPDGRAFLLNSSGDPDHAQRLQTVRVRKSGNQQLSLDPATALAMHYGGRGVCVCPGVDGANNIFVGGNGRTICTGSASGDDQFWMGRGGGVARGGAGSNVYNTAGGDNRLYLGGGNSLVSLFFGRADVIVPTTGDHWIHGFDPTRHRLSFRGQFADVYALRGVMQIETPDTQGSISYERNIVITLTGGGRVVLWGAGGSFNTLHERVRDFTHGWYAASWSEPVDYLPADFNAPFIPPEEQAQPQPTGSGLFDHDGSPIVLLGSDGSPVTFDAPV